MDLLTQFQKNWNGKAFVHKNQQVLLAISGGVDSMVLAYLFLHSGIKFGVAHCNFQLRGNDADLDELLVMEWSKQNAIPFYATRFETQKLSQEWKMGIQETARKLRYDWLETIRVNNQYAYLVTAHHANDNVETLLMNLFKGTGISGLHGIQEKHQQIIRPLLFASKNDIQEYAKQENIAYREDVSNSSDKYLRNAVRLHIIPTVEKYFPQAIQQVNESIQRFSQVEMLYRKEVERQIKKLVEQRGKDLYIPVLKLLKMEAKEAVCYELFVQYGFSAAQIPQVIQLASSESGHYMESESHKIIKDRDFLIITPQDTEQTDFISITTLPSKVELEDCSFHLHKVQTDATINASSTFASIDLDKITLPLTLRRWRTGDYFYPLGMGMKKKKLSKFFIDQKIPLHEKEKIWVLESDKKILWVAGMRLDERFKIKPTTKHILQVELWMH